MAVWIVTGGTRGLGAGLVEELLALNAQVAFCARSAKDVHAAEQRWGANVLGVIGSLADPSFVARLVSLTVHRFGGLDGIAANAAVLGSPPLSEVTALDPSQLAQILEANLLGNLRLIAVSHSHLVQSVSPRVLAITSDAAHAAYPEWSGYALSKAALEVLVETYGAEHPVVSTYILDPGDMDTALHAEALPHDPTPLRAPREVASAAAPLLHGARRQSGRYRLAPNGAGILALEEVTLRVAPVSS